MAKEGRPIFLILSILVTIFIIVAIINQSFWGKLLALGSVLCLLFSLYFFRDPERTIPEGDRLIVSPADGRIILIQDIGDDMMLKSRAQKVSIFMSVFDVHVNRVPIKGRVFHVDYQRGRFYPAYQDHASLNNEQTTIGIENDNIKIVFKQIAGILARRIVCHLREGICVSKGERFGMIKLGSRIDLFLPREVKLHVKLNEKVKAGVSIIGTY